MIFKPLTDTTSDPPRDVISRTMATRSPWVREAEPLAMVTAVQVEVDIVSVPPTKSLYADQLPSGWKVGPAVVATACKPTRRVVPAFENVTPVADMKCNFPPAEDNVLAPVGRPLIHKLPIIASLSVAALRLTMLVVAIANVLVLKFCVNPGYQTPWPRIA